MRGETVMANKTTTNIEMDGPHLVEALHRAGMDPARLDLRNILGTHVDVEELQSRLRQPRSSTHGSWRVSVTVSHDD
jgi:hypothetical protein